ncbi:MAG: hypothetical protein R2864_10815 [Syntrophotaleaceae bacterium]
MPDKRFKFPLGIAPWASESHQRQRLREGFSFSLLEKSTDSYRFTAMADAGRIQDIFQAFAAILKEEAFFILEFYREEPSTSKDEQPSPTLYYSPYLPTEEILATILPYLPRLIHDGFVGFGLANNHSGLELFYSEEKVLTCFTENHIRIMDLLHGQGLPYYPDLLLTSDLGHDHLSLLCHPKRLLPAPLNSLPESELDYLCFCEDLADLLDMYPVEEGLSFFLSRREQAAIKERLEQRAEFANFAEEDFGELLLSWHDFVQECEAGFEGDLDEYHQGLKLRDIIQYVMEGVPKVLHDKLVEIVTEPDGRFRSSLSDCRKRLDAADDIPLRADRFWYRGISLKQGTYLRRDLIRSGWYNP